MKKINFKKEEGFTLVEMMVAIALFSIVLIVVMGSIITIIDVNRKAQSLSVVMNDLNFSLESITRTIKTGEVQGSAGTFDAIQVENQDGDLIEYRFNDGALERQVTPEGGSAGGYISITSSQIDIQEGEFRVFDGSNNQPRVLILISGEVQASPKISSDFKIQTTVSQRNLDF